MFTKRERTKTLKPIDSISVTKSPPLIFKDRVLFGIRFIRSHNRHTTVTRGSFIIYMLEANITYICV